MSYLATLAKLQALVERLSPRPKPPKRRKPKAKAKRTTRRRRKVAPPRSEPDVTELQQAFAPAPTPPGPISPIVLFAPEPSARAPRPTESDEARIIRLTAEAQAQQPTPIKPAPSTSGRRQCTAFDSSARRRCCLLEGHTVPHRHERGVFGMDRRAELDTAAWRTTG